MKLISYAIIIIFIFIIYYVFRDAFNVIKKHNQKLKGIDEIIVISLKGSKRREHMIRQFDKVGISEYKFIEPINFLVDEIDIKELEKLKIIPKDMSIVNHEMKRDNKWRLGTISLSIITYYLYVKAYNENKKILILEDNVVFKDNFVDLYNDFYDNLPDDNWQILDLHSKTTMVNQECKKYYEELKEIYPEEIKKKMVITDDRRAKINDKVLLGCNESQAAKAYVIRPTSIKYIPPIPIIYPADGIKNHISGYWKEEKTISYYPRNSLLSYTIFMGSERNRVDDLTKQVNYNKLEEGYIKNILETIRKYYYEK